MKYYVYEKGQQAGPFSIDELKKRSLNIHTPVWNESMLDWQDAGTVDELAPIFSSSRSRHSENKDAALPATLSNNNTPSQNINIPKLAGWSFIAVIVIIASWAFVFSDSEVKGLQASTQTVEEEGLSYLKKEQKDPTKYITGKFKSQETIKGQKLINLELHNNAVMAGFRDIIVNITYMNKLGEELGSEKITVNESLAAGQSLSTTIATNSGINSGNIKLAIESASVK